MAANTASSEHKRRHHERHRRPELCRPGLCSASVPSNGVDAAAERLTSADDDDERRASASSESLDSVVERILENAAFDTDRQRSSKRRRHREKATSSGNDCRREDKEDAERVDHNEQRSTTTSANDRDMRSSTEHGHSQKYNGVTPAMDGRRQHQRSTEKTLEDLFEEAVESLGGDVVDWSDSVPPAPSRHRRLRSAENWEREIYDSELHEQCRHYRLQTYTSRDVSRVSRGFVLVQTRDKTHTPATTSRGGSVDEDSGQRGGRDDAAGDVAYRQRTIVSATKSASNDSRQAPSAPEDDVDLGLDAELAANERRRSSTATWDSVSVDSLLMYDDDDATVHAVYSSSSTQGQQRDDEFVDRLRRLHDDWTTAVNNDDQEEHSDAVWVPMSRDDTLTQSIHGDSRQPETDGMMTSLEDTDSGVILSDCVTSQHVVINIKVPRRCRLESRDAAPTVPFRELRLRREIRFSDDVETPSSSSGAGCSAAVTSSRAVDDVTSDEVATPGDSVLVSADSLLGAGDLSTMFAGAEVEFDNRDSSRSVELVPVCDGAARACASQRVQVSRREATRVVRLPTTTSSRLVYDAPSLAQTVDSIRRALLSGARDGARAHGVSVTCEAVESVTRRGDQSAPVVRNIVVDCLPPRSS